MLTLQFGTKDTPFFPQELHISVLYVFSHSINSVTSTLGSAMFSAPRGSGIGGGGGGSSGGGFGGGGDGSW